MVRELSQEKREKFLQAALKLFVANGVAHTTTAEIARLAGTAAGTLFLYFPTKQHLIHELVLTIGRQQSEYIHTLLDPSLGARDTLFTIWSGSLRWMLENQEAFSFIQQVRDSGILAAEVVQESGKYFDYYYHAIQKGLSEGSIKPYSVELIGGFLYQDLVAVMNILKMEHDPARQQELIQTGFDIFWNGIKR
jgi:AcrR family transcriptional regulator